jgi:hypothetical protein
MSIEIERDPEECVAAVIESDGTVRHFVVLLRRADGQEIPINVASTDEAIELVRSMNPEKISLRVVDGEARDAMLRAFHTYDVDVDASKQQTQRRTLH